MASFDLSLNGEKMLLRVGAAGAGGRGGRGGAAAPAAPQYVIVSAAAPLKPGEGVLRLADVEVNVDPIAEWKQMYHEVWRIERSYFYDPNLHGVNVADAEKEYEKYLDSLGSRSDLNYIIHDMISDMSVGHLRGGGGNIPQARTIPGGLLGADYEIAGGRYRFKRIYTGESWNPQLQAPLAAPGLNVAAGDYLLASERAGTHRQGGRLAPAREHRGQARGDQDRNRRFRRRGARDHGGARGKRDTSCATRRGSKPTAAKWMSSAAANWLTSTCRTRRRAG